MSLEAMTWAFSVPIGGTQKVLLLGLADHAHPDGSNAFPSLERLSRYAHCDRSTVIRNLKKLETAKLIARDGQGPKGTVSYRLSIDEGVDICHPRVAPMPPEPVVVEKEEEQPGRGGSGGRRVDATPADELVWSHYVAVMAPRHSALDAESRRLLREALKVASVDECCRAIHGCAASDFHMGKNDKARKYNALSQILKGKRGGRTTREQIDFFIDVAERNHGGGVQPSAIREKVAREKLHVRTGLAAGATEVHTQRGNRAANWLAQHGIHVVSDATAPDGIRFESSNDGGTT